MGIRLIAGRNFDEHDQIGQPPVAVVNEALARRYFRGQGAVGIVTNVRTGEVLALASWPEFDLGNPGGANHDRDH